MPAKLGDPFFERCRVHYGKQSNRQFAKSERNLRDICDGKSRIETEEDRQRRQRKTPEERESLKQNCIAFIRRARLKVIEGSGPPERDPLVVTIHRIVFVARVKVINGGLKE